MSTQSRLLPNPAARVRREVEPDMRKDLPNIDQCGVHNWFPLPMEQAFQCLNCGATCVRESGRMVEYDRYPEAYPEVTHAEE